MEWISTLFSSIWFDAALLAFGFAVCCALLTTRHVPKVWAGPPLSELLDTPLAELGEELRAYGFQYNETLECEIAKGKSMVLIR